MTACWARSGPLPIAVRIASLLTPQPTSSAQSRKLLPLRSTDGVLAGAWRRRDGYRRSEPSVARKPSENALPKLLRCGRKRPDVSLPLDQPEHSGEIGVRQALGMLDRRARVPQAMN